jgi:dephospho-CoA kinase
VVVITAPEKVRRMRSQAATDKREQRLIPDREKMARADYGYVNTGTPAELEEFVRSVMDDLTG